MNIQLVRGGLPPIYIKVEDKTIYIKALEEADKGNNYDELYELTFRLLLRSHIALSSE